MTSKVDLHCHTLHSDGSLSVSEIIERASALGVEKLAITDHDTTAAHFETAVKNNSLPIQILPGVEISTVCEKQELHIVALGIDIQNSDLQQLLKNNRQARKIRASKILDKFEKSGLADLSNELSDIVKGEVVCRSHLAQLLCSQSIVKDFKRAFKQYLGKNAKAWVPVQWQDLSEVINIIKEAGGTAILAHPTKYKLSHTRLALVIDFFVAAGGEALEIAYPGLNPSERMMLERQVEKHQLSVSQGSDFHHPKTVWTELGAFGVNPEKFNVVWNQL